MKVYLYAKSGHAIGLEATKKCAVIANILKEFDPILCTSDFRAGAFAKENLGIKKYVNIDVIRNLTNITQRNDILFYSSDEVNEQMKEDMKDLYSLLYCIDDFKEIVVDKNLYFKTENPKLEKTIFFGDDDYKNDFFNEIKSSSNKFDINLLMGHYFFLGNEKIFKEHFTNVIDEEEYVNTIQNSKYLLTGSLQTALESISCGNKPVLFRRNNKFYDEKLIEELNIPFLDFTTFEELFSNFENITNNYPSIKTPEIKCFDDIISTIKEKIKLFEKLTNF